MDPSSPPLKDFLGLAGVRVGPYVVTEIGSLGGVALIYRGEHETLHNAVAVKVLTPEVATADVRDTLEALFLREAQILSQLRSEHILRAHHHGRIACPADGRERPYLVVDWLEGETLADELDRRRREQRPYQIGEAVELLEPIALALDTAHAAGIIHRDVNPRNIFLETTAQGPPRAKLIDFGFAKDVAATRALQLERVHGTLLARSPDYAAPEHYDREKYGDLSENTDIYTFALTLVEMLTLHSPLRGATAEALAYATSNREDRPTPNNRGANVPHNVEELFGEALAVDQFERPGSLLGWYRQVQQALRHPTTRPPEPRSLPAPKKRRLAPWIALGGLLAVAIGLGVFFATRPLKCAPGFADCNGERSDGCEVELAASTLHCGGCGRACDTTHGAVACASGACRIERCADESRRDCNGAPADGCEVEVATDVGNCGACGKRCGADGTTKVGCEAGKCELTCVKDRGDCDGRSENGCEVPLHSDVENCGRCGFSCKDSRCEAGYCVPKKLASLEAPFEIAPRAGEVYVWEAKRQRLRSVSAGRDDQIVAERVDALSALAAAPGGLFYVAGEPPRLFRAAAGTDAGAPLPSAGPLAGPTPLVLDLEGNQLTYADRTPRGKKPAKRTLTTLTLTPDASKPRIAQCPDWPARFVADAKQLFCCDDTKPLSSITCPSGKCASRRHPFPCPESMALDTDTLYFFRGTRLYAMDRFSGKATQIAKRVRPPRELVHDGSHLYWLEGTTEGAIFRLPKPERAKAPAEAPEAIAGNLKGAGSLAVDDVAIYWTVAEGPTSADLLSLQKPR